MNLVLLSLFFLLTAFVFALIKTSAPRENAMGTRIMCAMGRKMNMCSRKSFRKRCGKECNTYDPYFDYETGKDLLTYPCEGVKKSKRKACDAQHQKPRKSRFCDWGVHNGSCQDKQFRSVCGTKCTKKQ